jgi:ribulose-phosphate 3-epimerase
MNQVKIAPSLLSSDFGRLAEEIARVEEAGADWLHVDVMDGHFVPNLTLGPPVVTAIRKVAKIPLDVHLMVSNPAALAPSFVAAGAEYLTVHIEVEHHMHRLVSQIRELGAKPGVVLNPSTSLVTLEEILPEIDMVLLMSVNPGFGGQSFIPSSVDKIRRLRDMIVARQLQTLIEVDGGVNVETAPLIRQAGANVLVAGTAVFGKLDLKAAIRELRG